MQLFMNSFEQNKGQDMDTRESFPLGGGGDRGLRLSSLQNQAHRRSHDVDALVRVIF